MRLAPNTYSTAMVIPIFFLRIFTILPIWPQKREGLMPFSRKFMAHEYVLMGQTFRFLLFARFAKAGEEGLWAHGAR